MMAIAAHQQTTKTLLNAREVSDADQLLTLEEEDMGAKCQGQGIVVEKSYNSMTTAIEEEDEDGELWLSNTSCSSSLLRRRSTTTTSDEDNDDTSLHLAMSGPPQRRRQQQQHDRCLSRQEKIANRRIHEIMFPDSRYSSSSYSSSSSYTSSSSISRDNMICTFDMNEIHLGLKLGRGFFADVQEICSFVTTQERQGDEEEEEAVTTSSLQTRTRSRKRFMSENCISPNTGKGRYAMKQLRPDLIITNTKSTNDDDDDDGIDKAKKTSRFWAGLTDLVVESKILRQLEHAHIIKLHGVAKNKKQQGVDDDDDDDLCFLLEQNFFLILDRLYDTLFTRIHCVWKDHLDNEPHPLVARLTGHYDKAKRYSNRFLLRRLVVARDLSSAITYLHDEKRLCHRDIKPDNIGFDATNQVKLFDFGLARKLSSSSYDEDETFHLTQMSGSLRYMAPEVMLGIPYNQKCDVYSFSVVLWEIITCQQAYSTFSREDVFVYKVGRNQVRPPLLGRANNKACQDMLRAGWHANLKCRASMRDMQSKLEAEIKRLQENCKAPNNHKTSLDPSCPTKKHQQHDQHQHGMNLIKRQLLRKTSLDTFLTFREEEESMNEAAAQHHSDVVWI